MKLVWLFFISVSILKLDGSDRGMAAARGRANVYKYNEVYDSLAQAVLEGDVAKFTDAINSPGAKLDQILTCFYTLRHVAFIPEIDEELKRRNIAMPRYVATVMVPLEFNDNELKVLRTKLHYTGPGSDIWYHKPHYSRLRSNYDKPVIELEDKYEDIYGKNPDHYSYDEREELAKKMREGTYSSRRRITLDFDLDKVGKIIDIRLPDKSDATK